MTTAPFPAAVAELVQGSHEHYVTAEYSLDNGTSWTELDVVDGQLSWQERRSPRVVADVMVPVPEAAVLAALDPRAWVLARFTATYVLPNGSKASAVVAKLHLRTRSTSRPDGLVRLTFSSIEAALIDGLDIPDLVTIGAGSPATPEPISVDPTATLKSRLEGVLFGPAAVGFQAIVTARGKDNVDAPAYASNGWGWLQDIADAAGLEMFDPGDGLMRVADLPVIAADTAGQFAAGANSVILTSDSDVTREDFANQYLVDYSYEAGTTPNTYTAHVYGTAKVAAGPFSWAAAGRKVAYEARDGKVSQAFANAQAGQLLALAVSRSRGLTLTAVPHWWIRPGQTITVQLPAADEDRHLVSEVTFDLTRKEMRIVTRRPDSSTITIGE